MPKVKIIKNNLLATFKSMVQIPKSIPIINHHSSYLRDEDDDDDDDEESDGWAWAWSQLHCDCDIVVFWFSAEPLSAGGDVGAVSFEWLS